MLFYDFEVFKYDWLVVIIDMTRKEEHVVINDPDELERLYYENKKDIWAGFNSRHYDQWIFKAILCGFDPKKVNDYIIIKDKPGYQYSSLFRNYPLNNYDVMNNIDRGLKVFEGFMGNSIRETSVPFDIDRKLTDEEIAETVKYCRHDVEQTIQVFLKRREDFEAHMGLVRIASGEGNPLDLSLVGKTKPQLSAIILQATRQEHDDEFDIDFPDTMRIEKYTPVVDWYRNPENRCYTKWNPEKKKWEKNPLQLPLKLVLNSTYGVMKDANNDLYDPLQANKVCIYGQLLLLDLMERLEPYCKIIQSNTDGILIKLKDGSDAAYEQIDDICYEWEKRTGLKLEFDEYREVFQKDVNNYIVIDAEGHYKSKGAYIKKLDSLDYDLPIVNKALIEYMVHHIHPEQTVNACDDLKEFQLVTKISSKYRYILHGAEYHYEQGAFSKSLVYDKPGKRINEKCVRIFASLNPDRGGVFKVNDRTGKPEKISNSPEHCFIFNDDVNGVKCPNELDKEWYVKMATKRLLDFGVIV